MALPSLPSHIWEEIIRIRERLVIIDYVKEARHMSEAHQIAVYKNWRSWSPYYEANLLSFCKEILPRIHLRPILPSMNISAAGGYVSVEYLEVRFSGGVV